MTIKRYKALLKICMPVFLFCLTETLLSCSDEEDTTPSYADLNGFEPTDNDNSATAQLRREFFQQTGSYLLFTDTLTTKSTNGKPEMLEVAYSIFGTISNNYAFEFDYITNIDEQRKAADIVKRYLISKLGKATPFSILLVNDIYYTYYGSYRYETLVQGLRSYAISMSNGEAYKDPEKYFNSMLADLLYEYLYRQSDKTMSTFYNFSNEYYSKSLSEFGLDDTDESSYSLGFFYCSYGWCPYKTSYYKNNSNDLWLWVNAALYDSPEDFEAEFGDYEVMMGKYYAIRKIIIDLGFSIE